MVRKTGVRVFGVGLSGTRVSGIRLMLSGLVLLLAPGTWRLTLAVAQQPQAQQGQPLSALNAKYVNGVAPGYWPTNGTGLTLNLSAGTSVCGNSQVSYAGSTLTMTASATNYVFLDMTKNCAPAFTSGGTGFPLTGVPIAVVTTSSSAITAISDARTWFAARPVVDAGGQVYNVKAFGATGNGSTDDTAAVLNTIGAASAGGTVLFPPGKYLVSSQIVVQVSNLLIDGYGATLLCNVAANCMRLGDSVAWHYSHITIEGLGFSPAANSAGYSALEDNATGTHMIELKPINNGSYTFGNFIQEDNDQSFLIDGLDMSLGTSTTSCTASACGVAVLGMQGAAYSALGTIKDSNLSMGCNGNSVNWGGGQLNIFNSVLQAYSEYGLKIVPNLGGSSSHVSISGGDIEAGSCSDPIGNVGKAGIISIGGGVTTDSGPGGGILPTFPQNGTPGSTQYEYWIVANSSTYGASVPIPIGNLTNGNATISSANSVTVTFPLINDGAFTTFDLLRKTGSPSVAPYGTGNFAVATGLAVGTYCTSTLCTFTDTVATPSSYTVSNNTGYVPSPSFWPGGVVLLPGSVSSPTTSMASYFGGAPGGSDVVVAPCYCGGQTHAFYIAPGPDNAIGYIPANSPTVDSFYGVSTPAGHPPSILIPPAYPGAFFPQLKGVLNFGLIGQTTLPLDFMTLWDSNAAKTFSTWGHHPYWDQGDAAIGKDTGSLSFRSPDSITNYVNNLPDGSSWLWRLNSAGIAEAVPHYGLSTASSGAPNTPALTDESSLITCLTSHVYAQYAVCYDGANFEEAVWGGQSGSTPPSWATTPGSLTTDGNNQVGAGAGNPWVVWKCLGPGTSLSANTTYYVKVAGQTVGGNSTPSSEASISTANDGAHHLLLATGTAKPGHTSYQVGCATTSGNETLLSAPFTGAYSGNSYVLPIVSCSGSGSFGSTDTTGYGTFPGLFVGGGTAINEMNLYSTASITPTAVNGASCSDQTFAVTGLLATDRISNITPPAALGNVSLNGYASASGTVLLHFCNPSSSSVSPPAGVYSFLAVH